MLASIADCHFILHYSLMNQINTVNFFSWNDYNLYMYAGLHNSCAHSLASTLHNVKNYQPYLIFTSGVSDAGW